MIIHQSELSEKLKVLKSISSAKLGDDLSGVLLKDKMLMLIISKRPLLFL